MRDDLDAYLQEQLRDPQVNAAYIDAGNRAAFDRWFIKRRAELGLSLLELATQAGMVKNMGRGRALRALKEFEAGGRRLPLEQLQACARVMGKEVKLDLTDPSPNTAPYGT